MCNYIPSTWYIVFGIHSRLVILLKFHRRRSTSILVGTNINIVNHLQSSNKFDNPLKCFGSHANDGRTHDGVGFVYDQYTSRLTVKVKYRACSLSPANAKGWIPCSELFSHNNDVLELGTIFPFAVNMMMVQQFVGNNKARASALDTPNI
jgi:hypothetical protein